MSLSRLQMSMCWEMQGEACLTHQRQLVGEVSGLTKLLEREPTLPTWESFKAKKFGKQDAEEQRDSKNKRDDDDDPAVDEKVGVGHGGVSCDDEAESDEMEYDCASHCIRLLCWACSALGSSCECHGRLILAILCSRGSEAGVSQCAVALWWT